MLRLVAGAAVGEQQRGIIEANRDTASGAFLSIRDNKLAFLD